LWDGKEKKGTLVWARKGGKKGGKNHPSSVVIDFPPNSLEQTGVHKFQKSAPWGKKEKKEGGSVCDPGRTHPARVTKTIREKKKGYNKEAAGRAVVGKKGEKNRR